ncbi:hypothetical protein [Phaeobacter inhibens]|uniref:hypothetical protein n=1 Tax=Phaeobacter inhibens TaxID=221822 RepID=UPI0021A3E05A|nr:hypothetical protein [Phaeobacter inhibens]UWS06409.1 hypothetical protein K4K98_08970 [Phaeobacter inhibens]
MGVEEDLKHELANMRKLLDQAQRAGRSAPSRASPAVVAQQLQMPDVVRFPLAQFAAGRGRKVPLPELVQEIAEVVGRENAVKLVEGTRQRGARRWRRHLYIPSDIPENHRIVSLIGWDAAQALSFSHANSVLELPSCHGLRKAYLADVVIKMAGRGADPAEIASELGVERKTVASLLDLADYWAPRLV